MAIAKMTKTIEDERLAKHARSLHSQNIKKRIKEYYTNKLNTSRNKFKASVKLKRKNTPKKINLKFTAWALGL